MSCFGYHSNQFSIETLKKYDNLMSNFQLEISPYFVSGKLIGTGQVPRRQKLCTVRPTSFPVAEGFGSAGSVEDAPAGSGIMGCARTSKTCEMFNCKIVKNIFLAHFLRVSRVP